ncbi:MAG TPA: serine hydrolase [Symbiobacteriaceae bacterium]|nr:serine hydrolase [Symbiobacteriaceae bacterium]
MRPGRQRDPRAWSHIALTLSTAIMLAGCSFSGNPVRAAATDAAVAISTSPVVQSLASVGPPAQAAPVTAEKTTAASATAAPDLNRLRKQLQDYLASQKGTYGVFVLDLATGKSVGINGDMVFPAASTFKLPMSLYILDQAARGKVSLHEKIAYTRADYEEGTGTLQEWIKPGNALTVRELIDLAITQSDNIATQMLLRRFGVQNVYDYMRRLGGKVTHYEAGVVGTTPREMAAYMRNAQGSHVIGNAELRAFLMQSLENTAFDDRTAAGVPDGVAVAHKIGTLPGVVNDVALVEAPEHPFIIAAFSLGVDERVAPAVISEMTKRVYEFLTAS